MGGIITSEVNGMRHWIYKAFFCACLFLGSGEIVYSQNTVLIDSLRKAYRTADPEKKFALLNAIGFEYRYSMPDSTIIYCTKAYNLGKSLHLTKDLSKSLSFIGLAGANKGDFKLSLDYHYKAIDVALEQHDSLQLAFGYNNLGRMFFDEGDLGRAFNNFTRSRDLFEILKNKSGLAYVFRSLSSVYRSQGDFGQALEMSNRAYELRKSLGELRAIVSALMESGLLYDAMNDEDRAIEKFKQADSLASRLHDKVTQAEVKMGMAEVLFKRGNYTEAFHATDGVLNVVTNQTNQKLFLRAMLIRAHYFYQQKAGNTAIPMLQEVIMQSKNNLSFKRDASLLLSTIYSERNDTKRAQEYLNEYKILDERLRNTVLTTEINQLKFKLDLEKKEKEIDLLKVNQAKDSAVITKQRFQNILLLISFVSISVVLFILWLHSRRRRVIHSQLEIQNQKILQQGREIEEKNRDLSLRNTELSDLNHEKDTLMSIVAHDLKSPINQILGLTQLMEIEGKQTPAQKEYLGLMKEASQSGLSLIIDLLDVNALREVKGELKIHPFDLKALTESRLRSFEPSANAKHLKLVLEYTGPGRVVSEAKYVNRILDNLISNAIKFSGRGTTIHVKLVVNDENASISVKDQGPGFSEDDRQFLFQRFKKLSARPTAGESSNGLGLTIVKTLVDRLQGDITLVSKPGMGSEFIISIPVKIAVKSAL